MFSRKRAETANTTLTPPPPPVVLTPSGDFIGNDGKWSTFPINVGDADGSGQGQNFKVLISTSSALVLVPGQAGWCNQECVESRGIGIFKGQQPSGFESKSSQSYKEFGIYSLPDIPWWSGDDKLNGTWGTENVGLGASSKDSLILTDQFIVEYNFEEFFLGSFGLAVNKLAPAGGERFPFLKNFYASANKTPSLSYGYTPGASYKNGKGVPANLVLGGYDETRADMNRSVSIDMPNAQDNTLLVGVLSITYEPDQDVEANRFSFTSAAEVKPFLATIDSTLPYMWLPEKICDQFEERYQLEYNSDLNLYTVNESSHRHNLQQNATLSFKIGANAQESDKSAVITLPYGALDLEVDYPIVNESTKYLPIKRAENGKYVLGRAFLQEAYLVVDYERLNFTVAPARFSQPMPDPKIISIYNKTYTPPANTPTVIPNTGGGGGGGLSPGTVAGVVVGIVVALLLTGLGAFFWWKKRRQQKDDPYQDKVEEIDTTIAGSEVKYSRVSELGSEPPGSPKPSTLGGYYGDRDHKDSVPFPPISEMESPPVELDSAVPLSSYSEGGADYFTAGNKVRRRGATRESSGNNTPGTPGLGVSTPVAELPGDDGKFQVGGVHFEPVASPKVSPVHSRGPSDASVQTNIDEVMARPEVSPERNPEVQSDAKPESGEASAEAESGEASTKPEEKTTGNEEEEAEEKKKSQKGEGEQETPLERRPSHTRGLSDITIQSDSTAVSQPTPEELEQWALGGNEGPRRPLSE